MFRVVENVRKKHLAWVQAVMDYRGWSQTQLAREAGLNPSTLSKFISGAAGVSTLGQRSIEKIEQVGGIPAFQDQPPEQMRGLSNNEAELYEPPRDKQNNDLFSAVGALKAGRNDIEAWILNSRCLETAGYRPGDVLLVDSTARAEPGDIVRAQVYDRNGRVETVFRVYEDPFLVAATFDDSLRRPLLVDNDRVVIRGVVKSQIRQARAAA